MTPRTTIPNVAKLRVPPTPGLSYYVPCLDYGGFTVPVIGPPHADPELGQTLLKHWHADLRFMTDDLIRDIGYEMIKVMPPKTHRDNSNTELIIVPSSTGQFVKKQIFQCVRLMPDYGSNRTLEDGWNYKYYVGKSIKNYGELEDSMEGKCLIGNCLRCPHKGLPLASMKPAQGKITCPGHNLDFDETTGKLVRRTKKVFGGYVYQ